MIIQYSRTFAPQLQTPWNQAHAPLPPCPELSKFQQKPKNIVFQKSSYIYIKTDLLFTCRPKSLKLLLLYNESEHNILAFALVPKQGQQTSEKGKLRKQWAKIKLKKNKIGYPLQVTSHRFTDSEQVSVGLGKWAARKGEPSDCPLTVKDDKSPVTSCVSQPRPNF
jgi:hypothetical protein